MILDIHTHHAAPQPQAVISVTPSQFSPVEGQLYSVGLHPWDGTPSEADWNALEAAAVHPQVVAVGECGIDPLRGGLMYAQLLAFKRHVDLSERLRKPLVIHEVKAHDTITGLHRDLAPAMPWAIHGFRAKPGVAQMMARAGIYLSFGAQFNAASLATVPPEVLLAETDEAPCTIADVIASMQAALPQADVEALIAANTANFLAK